MSAHITVFDRFPDTHTIGLRLAPLDVGFDLRTQRMPVRVAADTTVASYADHAGRRYVVQGTTSEVVRVLRAAGYTIEPDAEGSRQAHKR